MQLQHAMWSILPRHGQNSCNWDNGLGANEQSLGECLKFSMSSSTAQSQGLLAGMINVKNTESKTSPCGLKTSRTSGKVFAYITVAFGLRGLILFKCTLLDKKVKSWGCAFKRNTTDSLTKVIYLQLTYISESSFPNSVCTEPYLWTLQPKLGLWFCEDTLLPCLSDSIIKALTNR